MSNFDEGDALLFMKVGTHASEPLEEIIARKRREIDEVGFGMWGYGGNTCHPTSMVQPFAIEHNSAGRKIYLVMKPMHSNHFAEQLRAREFSRDGVAWEPVPEGINVLGSRYALCVRSLEVVEEQLSLGDTRVAVGNSRGRSGAAYVKGRVDKACLIFSEASGDGTTPVDIRLRAEIIDPYAVFVRS